MSLKYFTMPELNDLERNIFFTSKIINIKNSQYEIYFCDYVDIVFKKTAR